jgi:ABC-type nitrate/sulfonate/bicarbonate transport system substrate-binding protein
VRLAWAALAAAFATAACGGTAAPAPSASTLTSAAAQPPTRISASQNVTANAPIWLTKEANLFAQTGLNADLQNINANNAIKELVAGHIDAFIGGSPEVISARAAGSPLTIVAVFSNKYDMLMTLPKDIASMDQLKGKTVGVITRSSVNGVATVAAMKKYGLQADKDYKIVETGSGSPFQGLAAALQSHNIAAAALQPDFARKMAAGGEFHIEFDLAKQPELITAGSTLTFQSSYVQQHPAEVQKTLDSLLLGQRYFREHRDQAQALLRQTFKITDQADLDESFDRLRELMARDPTPRPELYPDLVEAIGQISPDVKNLDLAGLLDPRFAQDALKRSLAG